MNDVLVEVCDSHMRCRGASAKTDREGSFSLPGAREGRMYYLRLSKPAFSSELVKVIIKRAAPAELRLPITPAR